MLLYVLKLAEMLINIGIHFIEKKYKINDYYFETTDRLISGKEPKNKQEISYNRYLYYLNKEIFPFLIIFLLILIYVAFI
jgi:hypothetical protein